MHKTYDDTNIFARILKKEIPATVIYENDQALAFYDIAPQAPIHVLVIPKGKYIDYQDFCQHATSQELVGFHSCIAQVLDLVHLEYGHIDKGFRIISNSGYHGGQEVLHFHLHILGGKILGKMLHD